jgi:hypothetical protein
MRVLGTGPRKLVRSKWCRVGKVSPVVYLNDVVDLYDPVRFGVRLPPPIKEQ